MLVVVLVLPSYAQAATGGFGYSGNTADRTGIQASAVRGQSSEAEFTVYNNGASDRQCEVWVDSPYSWWITFDQSSFTLGSGEHKTIKMIVDAPYNGSDRNKLTVYLRGVPTESTGTPVAIAYPIGTEVTLSGSTEAPSDDSPTGPGDSSDDLPWTWAVLLVAVIVVGVAGYFIYKARFKGGVQK